ncbi:MAG: VOC family protein [Candidatus Zixiibacteriota bacterium]|nr:MAG: VOC family protein [candidate division Zixibacteria bacterium]
MSNDKPPHGTFIWNELVARDMQGAEKFYTGLLGWKAVKSDMPGMKYTVFKTGDRDSGGLMEMPPDVPKEVPAHWMAYITVDDVDAAAEKTKELGGQLLHGPQDVPDVGRFCIIQDPAGAVVSLITMSG